MRQPAGFTLLEVLIVVGVIGVATAISVPTIAGAMDRYEVISAGQQVASTIRATRFQAVSRNRNTRIRFDVPAAGQYQTEVWDSATATWVTLGDVQLLPQDVSFVATTTIEFGTSGRLAAGGVATAITLGNGDVVNNQTINVSTSGRIQLQ